MADEQPSEADQLSEADQSFESAAAPAPRQLPGWRTGAIPAWVLALGLVVLGVAGLGLASIGNAAGIVAVAVVEAAVVVLLFSWVDSTAPHDPTG